MPSAPPTKKQGRVSGQIRPGQARPGQARPGHQPTALSHLRPPNRQTNGSEGHIIRILSARPSQRYSITICTLGPVPTGHQAQPALEKRTRKAPREKRQKRTRQQGFARACLVERGKPPANERPPVIVFLEEPQHLPILLLDHAVWRYDHVLLRNPRPLRSMGASVGKGSRMPLPCFIRDVHCRWQYASSPSLARLPP